jgi:hypothetical protein
MFSPVPRRRWPRRTRRPQRRFQVDRIDASPLSGLEPRSLAAPSIPGIIAPFALHVFLDGGDGNAAQIVGTSVNSTAASNVVMTASPHSSAADLIEFLISPGGTASRSAGPLTSGVTLKINSPYPGISQGVWQHYATNTTNTNGGFATKTNQTLKATHTFKWAKSNWGYGTAHLPTTAIVYAPNESTGASSLTITDTATDAPLPPLAMPGGTKTQNIDYIRPATKTAFSNYPTHYQVLQTGQGPSGGGSYAQGAEPFITWNVQGYGTTLTMSGRGQATYVPPHANASIVTESASVWFVGQIQVFYGTNQIATFNETTATESTKGTEVISPSGSPAVKLTGFGAAHQGSTGGTTAHGKTVSGSWNWSTSINLSSYPNISHIQEQVQMWAQLSTVCANGQASPPGGDTTTMRFTFQITKMS